MACLRFVGKSPSTLLTRAPLAIKVRPVSSIYHPTSVRKKSCFKKNGTQGLYCLKNLQCSEDIFSRYKSGFSQVTTQDQDIILDQITQEICYEYEFSGVSEMDETSDMEYVCVNACDFPTDLSSYPVENLYKSLKHMEVDQILLLVERCYKTMDKIGLALCMKNIYRHQGRYKGAKKKRQFFMSMKDNMNFQILVACLTKHSKHYDSDIVLDMIKFLLAFRFISTEFPMRVYLHLARCHINDMQLDQLIYLAYSLRVMPEISESTILMEGIRALINTEYIISKVGSLNVWQQILLLDIFGNDLNQAVIEHLLKLLYDRSHREIHFLTGLELINALAKCNVNKTEYFSKLVKHCAKKIGPEGSKIRLYDLNKVITNVHKLADKEYYDELLLKVAERLTLRDKDAYVSIYIKVLVLRKLWEASLFDEPLLLHIINCINVTYDGLNIKDLVFLGLYVNESPVDTDLFQLVDTTSFTGAVISNLDWAHRKPKPSTNLANSLKLQTEHVIQHMWTRKIGSVPQWVKMILYPYLADKLKCPNTSQSQGNGQEQFSTLLNDVVQELNMSITQSKISGKHNIEAWDLQKNDKNGDSEQRITVICVGSRGYFHNVRQLKWSTHNIISSNKQGTDHHLIMIEEDNILKLEDQEIKENLVKRINCIKEFQEWENMNTWMLHNKS